MGVLRSATTTSGEQSVMMTGDSKTVWWCADSLDGVEYVSLAYHFNAHTHTVSLIDGISKLIFILSLTCTYVAAGMAGGRAFYGFGSGNIWLDQVRCQGYEDNILNCPANPLGRDDCTHAEDAGVNCGTGRQYSQLHKKYKHLASTSLVYSEQSGSSQFLLLVRNLHCMCFPTGCADGDIRLANGRNATQGRVEVCYGNVWGTVCDDFWSTGDARVVCRQLGFGGQGKTPEVVVDVVVVVLHLVK